MLSGMPPSPNTVFIVAEKKESRTHLNLTSAHFALPQVLETCLLLARHMECLQAMCDLSQPRGATAGPKENQEAKPLALLVPPALLLSPLLPPHLEVKRQSKTQLRSLLQHLSAVWNR